MWRLLYAKNDNYQVISIDKNSVDVLTGNQFAGNRGCDRTFRRFQPEIDTRSHFRNYLKENLIV
ncbi:hypothetical protein QUB60_13330 [Microcoleus sp. A2-C5]|uniref:hypothetical protein n=1 Tax=Microcoleus sp. A2-C2 TaxID=2818530 RepID=UPI002FD00D3C